MNGKITMNGFVQQDATKFTFEKFTGPTSVSKIVIYFRRRIVTQDVTVTSKYQFKNNVDAHFCVKVRSLYKIIQSTQNSLQINLLVFFSPKPMKCLLLKVVFGFFAQIRRNLRRNSLETKLNTQ